MAAGQTAIAEAVVPGVNGRVAFQGPVGESGSAIYTANPDGTAVRRVADSVPGFHTAAHPSWSPDGQRLAISREGIEVVNADGSGGMVITSGADSLPDWSPDATRIAFTRRDVGGGEQIFTVASDGSGLQQLTDDSSLKSRHARWSPDGNKIVFSRSTQFSLSHDLWVMDADGGNETILKDASSADSYSNASWSPDGTKIVFNRGQCCSQAIHVMDADGTDERSLGQRGATPVFSPDGTRVLFIDSDANIGSGRDLSPLATVAVEGGPATSLNLAAFVFPSWGTAPLLTGDEGDDPMLRPQCSNGRDDDLDGRVDHPADLGCSSPIDDFERDRFDAFRCRAVAVRSSGMERTVANPAFDPCVDATVSSGGQPLAGVLDVAGQWANTDAAPDDWFRNPPHVGDYGSATAEVTRAAVRAGTLTISVANAQATARATCSVLDAVPVLSSSSGVGVVTIGALSLAVGAAPLAVPVPGGVLRLNADVPPDFGGQNRVSRRAVWLDRPGELDDVVLAEATAQGVFGSCSPGPGQGL